MPVTVNVGTKKKVAAPEGPALADLSDFEVPGTRTEGMKAFWLWILIMLVICGGLAAGSWTQGVGIGVFAWWLAAFLGYFVVAPRMQLRRLRFLGPQIVVTSQNAPRLKTTLTKGSAMLRIEPPEAFLLEESLPQLRISGVSPPHYLVLTQAACDLLLPAELDCLVIRSLIQVRQRLVRRLAIIRFFSDTHPAARALAWPIGIYVFLLRHWWQDPAEQTADRLTLLLVKNHKLMTSAILKLHAATDPLMLDDGITPNDVDNYVRMGNEIGLEGEEISTHYKLGQAIHENSYLESRLQALDLWAQSPEFREASHKMAEARAAQTPAKTTPAAGAA